MNKKDKKGLLPELRFPEFEDVGNWCNPTIEDFFKVGSSKRVLQKDWTTHGIPFYRTRELVSLSKGEPFSSEIFISDELFSCLSENYGVPKEGDFLVSGVGTLGISYQVQKGDRFYFKDGNVLWLSKKSGINSTFFNYCFESDWIQNQIIGQTSKSTVGTYTIQNAKKTSFWCPPTPEEQQKIADCLSSLDELITAHIQKHEALQSYKKGLMQDLFPAEGETVPALRFSEFKNEGKWEFRKLADKDISDFVKKRLPLSELSINTYVSTENILADFGGIAKASKLPPSGSFTAYESGDILIANIRPYLKKVWVANRSGGASNDVIVVRPKNGNAFLSCILKSEVFINYVMQGAKGVKMPRGDIALMKEYPVAVPNSEEQQKIADCLSSLDELIAAQAKKIVVLKSHKKGLMQQLFPAMDEVTT